VFSNIFAITTTGGSRHSARGPHQSRYSARGSNLMFSNIPHLFLRWRGSKVYSQTGWEGLVAGFTPLDPPQIITIL